MNKVVNLTNNNVLKTSDFIIISISPFNFFKKDTWWNKRIFHINEIINKYYSNNVYYAIRNESYLDNSPFKWQIILWGNNKYTNLLSFKITKKILEINKHKNILLVCNTLLWWLYWLYFKKLHWIKYIFDNHNVEFLRFRRSGSFFWILVRILEWLIVRNSLHTIVCSNNDKQTIIDIYTTKVPISVIENWVEINEEKIRKQVDIYKNVRKSLDLTVNKKIVLFFWSFEYKPNIEALEIINTEIIPNSNNEILFMVIWKWIENFSTKNTNIKYIGYVPNIEDYIIWSDLVIAPLISGGWTKLKIIESLWYWKKVITTEIWWEWIEKWDSNLIIRNDWKTFGEAINENIVRNSPCTQNPKYSWTNKERELLSIINECRSKLL